MCCARREKNDYIQLIGERRIYIFFSLRFHDSFRLETANTNARWFILSAVCNRPGWEEREEEKIHFEITASIKCQRQCSDAENQRQRQRRRKQRRRKWKICSPNSNISFKVRMYHFYGNNARTAAPTGRVYLPCLLLLEKIVQFI